MPACGICNSNHREQIERELAAGGSTRKIGARYGFSKDAVSRHERNCMKRTPSEPEVNASSESLGRLHKLYVRVEKLLGKAEKRGDHKTAAAMLGQLDDMGRRLALAEKRPSEIRIRVSYDQEGSPPLDEWQSKHFVANLLLEIAQYPGICTDEQTLACIAHLVSQFRSEPLPARLQSEVDTYLRVLMEGVKGDTDGENV
jgi:hypothetical protein